MRLITPARLLGAASAVLVVWALAGGPLLLALGIWTGTALLALASAWRRRPERGALVLASVLAGFGSAVAVAHVAAAVTHHRVDYRGRLDVREVLTTFHPYGKGGLDDPLPDIRRLGYAYMSSGYATMTKPHASGGLIAAWSLGQLLPWLLAGGVLVLLLPIIREAEQGEPFSAAAARRLQGTGLVLLVAVPLVPIYRFLVAEVASVGTSVAPAVEPHLTVSLVTLLPGAVALVLAGVFRRGAELRELERRTV